MMRSDDSLKSSLANMTSAKWIVKFLTWLNVVLYRISGGCIANKVEGCPVCLVTMTGRKSGKIKTIALMYAEDGENVLLVASLGGAPQHPVWYHNLKAQPKIEIQLGSTRRNMLAHEASAEERKSVWPKAVAAYGSFAEYQKKTSRVIPVFICVPQT
jgi:F420H(2)-dependent quinone reductase